MKKRIIAMALLTLGLISVTAPKSEAQVIVVVEFRKDRTVTQGGETYTLTCVDLHTKKCNYTVNEE